MTESQVIITQRDVYEMLLEVKRTLDGMVTVPDAVRDHENRLREIESREDLSRRVAVMEASLTELQKRVWALPGAATLIALGALVFTLIRTY